MVFLVMTGPSAAALEKRSALPESTAVALVNSTGYPLNGPARTTHGSEVGEAWAGGGWWGVGPPPKTAREWRKVAAVLDSFNGDGFFVTARVVESKGPTAVVRTVAVQSGEKILGQYLPGGATQAFFILDKCDHDSDRPPRKP